MFLNNFQENILAIAYYAAIWLCRIFLTNPLLLDSCFLTFATNHSNSKHLVRSSPELGFLSRIFPVNPHCRPVRQVLSQAPLSKWDNRLERLSDKLKTIELVSVGPGCAAC